MSSRAALLGGKLLLKTGLKEFEVTETMQLLLGVVPSSEPEGAGGCSGVVEEPCYLVLQLDDEGRNFALLKWTPIKCVARGARIIDAANVRLVKETLLASTRALPSSDLHGTVDVGCAKVVLERQCSYPDELTAFLSEAAQHLTSYRSKKESEETAKNAAYAREIEMHAAAVKEVEASAFVARAAVLEQEQSCGAETTSCSRPSLSMPASQVLEEQENTTFTTRSPREAGLATTKSPGGSSTTSNMSTPRAGSPRGGGLLKLEDVLEQEDVRVVQILFSTSASQQQQTHSAAAAGAPAEIDGLGLPLKNMRLGVVNAHQQVGVCSDTDEEREQHQKIFRSDVPCWAFVRLSPDYGDWALLKWTPVAKIAQGAKIIDGKNVGLLRRVLGNSNQRAAGIEAAKVQLERQCSFESELSDFLSVCATTWAKNVAALEKRIFDEGGYQDGLQHDDRAPQELRQKWRRQRFRAEEKMRRGVGNGNAASSCTSTAADVFDDCDEAHQVNVIPDDHEDDDATSVASTIDILRSGTGPGGFESGSTSGPSHTSNMIKKKQHMLKPDRTFSGGSSSRVVRRPSGSVIFSPGAGPPGGASEDEEFLEALPSVDHMLGDGKKKVQVEVQLSKSFPAASVNNDVVVSSSRAKKVAEDESSSRESTSKEADDRRDRVSRVEELQLPATATRKTTKEQESDVHTSTPPSTSRTSITSPDGRKSVVVSPTPTTPENSSTTTTLSPSTATKQSSEPGGAESVSSTPASCTSARRAGPTAFYIGSDDEGDHGDEDPSSYIAEGEVAHPQHQVDDMQVELVDEFANRNQDPLQSSQKSNENVGTTVLVKENHENLSTSTTTTRVQEPLRDNRGPHRGGCSSREPSSDKSITTSTATSIKRPSLLLQKVTTNDISSVSPVSAPRRPRISASELQ
ncbi:unnamed protein product, partial [Amoebophrya sp. A25]|eukprot:GSA25T00002435001.1